MRGIEAGLRKYREEGLLRRLQIDTGLIDFVSNDYLGMSRNERVRLALIEALQNEIPLGASGSRLLGGNSVWHEQTESFLAQVFETESALLFQSGFVANLSLLSSLGDEETEFFSDELVHASLIDGISEGVRRGALRWIFRHNDLNQLEELLKRSRRRRRVIVTESVFSMDGDRAPLDDVLTLAERYEAFVVVDEAHATGVYGHQGLGCVSDLRTDYPRLIAIHTCGKALGAQGAFVLGSTLVRDLIVNRSRQFIFTTALSPLSSLQIEAAVREILRMPKAGSDLLQKASAFRRRLSEIAVTGKGDSQIVPVILGSSAQALQAAENLRAHGYGVRAVRFPTVAKGQERLRLALKSFHTSQELDGLYQLLKAELHEEG